MSNPRVGQSTWHSDVMDRITSNSVFGAGEMYVVTKFGPDFRRRSLIWVELTSILTSIPSRPGMTAILEYLRECARCCGTFTTV